MSDTQDNPTAGQEPSGSGKKSGAKDPNNKPGEPKGFLVTFRHNRAFELRVGRETLFFGPNSSQPMTEAQVNHPDFLQQKSYFVVQEA